MNVEESLWKRFLWPVFTPRLVEIWSSSVQNESQLDENIAKANESLENVNDLTQEERDNYATLMGKSFIIPGIPSYEVSMIIFGALLILLVVLLPFFVCSFVKTTGGFGAFMNKWGGTIQVLFVLFSLVFIFIGISTLNTLA